MKQQEILTQESETTSEDAEEKAVFLAGLASGFSNNHRVYPPELLEKIWNSPIPVEFKNKEFLGEYPHE